MEIILLHPLHFDNEAEELYYWHRILLLDIIVQVIAIFYYHLQFLSANIMTRIQEAKKISQS
jgi:hypothetical protein